MKCRKCQFENPTGTKFCGNCGIELGVACPYCNAPNPLKFKFCGACGHNLASHAEIASPKDLPDDLATLRQQIVELKTLRQEAALAEQSLWAPEETPDEWTTLHLWYRRALADNERLRNTLIEMTQGYVWIVDMNLNYTFVSPAVSDFLGYTMEELVGQNSAATLTPASREVLKNEFRRRIAQVPSPPDIYYPTETVDIERFHKDGSIRRHRITGTFLNNLVGKPIGILGIARDITGREPGENPLRQSLEKLEDEVYERTIVLFRLNEELKMEILERMRAEEALRNSEERFRTVFEAAQDFIFLKDTELRYTHVNPAMLSLLGIGLDRIIGNTDEDLFPAEWTKRMKSLENRVLAGQEIETEQNLLCIAQPLTYNFVLFPMRDSSGKIVGLCGIGRDVTEWRRTEAQVRIQTNPPGSTAMKRTLELVRRAARTDSVVLFRGESGSGKDYLAEYLHRHSGRASSPYFTINCAAIAPHLAESELFGHEPGAFTGARGRKRGLLELAEGGTLLLNEVGELSTELQAKILTFLDTQMFTRVGGDKNIQVNTRIIAATNRDLEKDIESDRFRKDLFYRLNVFAVEVPPLRERIEDLPVVVQELLSVLTRRMGLTEIPAVDAEALAALACYSWPGNVRELRNALERTLILCDKKRITAADLNVSPEIGVRPGAQGEVSVTVHMPQGGSLNHILEQTKRFLVTESLKQSGGSLKQAARYLGITRDALVHHMRFLGIRRDGS